MNSDSVQNMNKVTSVNRALRPVQGRNGHVAANNDELGQVQDLLQNYESREHDQQVATLQQKFTDAVTQLNAKFESHSRENQAQLANMQNLLENEKSNNFAAINNLKSLFDGNYQVMTGLATRYESEQEFVKNELMQGSSTMDERISTMHQESADKFDELRLAMEKAKLEERSRFAQALRALADSLYK